MDIPSGYIQSIQESYPDLAIRAVRMHPAGGQFNDILILNEALVFRFPRLPQGVDLLLKETRILEQIRPYLSLPVPDPVYQSRDRMAGRAFAGHPMLPGETLWQETLEGIPDEETLQRLADQLAGFLKGLHSIPLPAAGTDLPLHETRQEWSALYQDIRQHLFNKMRSEARDRVEEDFEEYLAHPDLYTFQPAFRHGDFGPSNILFDRQTRRISGILDFAFAGPGDPAVDLAAVSVYGQPFVARFIAVYPEIELMWRRIRFYKSTFALQEAIYGYHAGDRKALESGLEDYI
jgi:aminoglycoside 2''-phosphotransferase